MASSTSKRCVAGGVGCGNGVRGSAEDRRYNDWVDAIRVGRHGAPVCIVSIATALSISESERLLLALREQGIAVRRGVLNRLVDADAEDAYAARLAQEQSRCLEELRGLAARGELSTTEVPYFDVEVRAVYGLRAMGAALFDQS